MDRLALYQAHKVDSTHLVPLYGLLCARDTPLSLAESRILGLETMVLIATKREQLRASAAAAAAAAAAGEVKSPLPEGLEMLDVFKALERELGLEEGTTERRYKDNGLTLPTGG